MEKIHRMLLLKLGPKSRYLHNILHVVGSLIFLPASSASRYISHHSSFSPSPLFQKIHLLLMPGKTVNLRGATRVAGHNQ